MNRLLSHRHPHHLLRYHPTSTSNNLTSTTIRAYQRPRRQYDHRVVSIQQRQQHGNATNNTNNKSSSSLFHHYRTIRITTLPLLVTVSSCCAAILAVPSFSSSSSNDHSRSLCSGSTSTHGTENVTTNKQQNHPPRGRRRKVKVPPRYGMTMPRHPAIWKGQQQQKGRRYASSTTSTTNSSTTITTAGSDEESKIDDPNNPLSIISSNKKDRTDCPLCKKFSRGPCGPLFTRWMDTCIDDPQPASSNSNASGDGGGEKEEDATKQRCDDMIRALDACLKDHAAYYDKISLYDDDDDNDDEEGVDGSGSGSSRISDLKLAWHGLITGLESRAMNDDDEEGSVTFQEFTKELKPYMEVRLKDKTGMVQFHPTWSTSSSIVTTGSKSKKIINNTTSSTTTDTTRSLLMGYVKDQDGVILGAGSVEDLLSFIEADDKETLVLRFAVTDETKDVTACALYGNAEGVEEEDLFMFRMTQRLPSK